jgi:hypothetical protein
MVIGTTAMSSWRIREVRTERPRVVRADILHVELRDLEHTRRFVRVPAKDSQHGLVPIDAPERRVRCLRTVHPDNRANEVSWVGGVDGTRTRGLRRDRPAF